MSTIGSLMKTEMVLAEPGETVRAAAERMAGNGVGAVLLVEDDKLVGLFTERDLLSRVVAQGKDPDTTAVEAVATRNVVTADVHTNLRDCSALVRDRGFRHLPVTDDGRPVGVLSTRDFLDYIVGTLEGIVDQALYEQKLAEGEDPYDHPGGSYGR